MIDPKEVYRKILEEHLYEICRTSRHNVYADGWFDSRLHILELMGFKKEEINTPVKVIKIIEKYNEEIKAWEQKEKNEKNL